MLIRLRVKHLGEEKGNSLGETIWRNLGNICGRKAILCRLLSALLFHYTETFKTCTSRSPSISLNSKEDFKRHPLTLTVLLLSIAWLQTEGFFISGTGGVQKGCLMANVCGFPLALRYHIHETKLVTENSQEVAVTLLPSTLV